MTVFNQYFEGHDVRSSFEKEIITLWPSWLGPNNLHLLDEVTEKDWSRFNNFISKISKRYELGIVDCVREKVDFSANIDETLCDYSKSMNKNSSQFSKYIIPELKCVISEEWDYTYILWHKGAGALEALSPYIEQAQLKHFKG